MNACDFTSLGAMLGLAVAIILIFKRAHPAYSLILGALAGGLLGGGGLANTVSTMVRGAQDMMPTVLRILTSGILAGALIQSGAAQKIAQTIVEKLGERMALGAIALATMIICAAGVFIDISVITVAPIALAIGKKAHLSTESLLLAMIGGGKAGNIISPNPNTIATAEAFHVDLTSLMLKNFIPALLAVAVTILLASFLARKMRSDADTETRQNDPQMEGTVIPEQKKNTPGFFLAILGPLVVIALLALRPLMGITIDPLIALPVGGIVCVFATRNIRNTFAFAEFGLSKVAGVSILLISTGTIAGIIKASSLQHELITLLNILHMPAFVLAPLTGIFLAGATASTTAGATIASQTFSPILTEAGIPPLGAGAMIHAGATVIDSLPHGSFFHATGGSVFLSIRQRMKLIPYEIAIGLTSTLIATGLYLLGS
ncbi:MAG: GntP family permease [Kiritimatiellae bacterium]|nr:GntP family permease [Kiritimatiellia bacterium]